jgi:hypothetical protein
LVDTLLALWDKDGQLGLVFSDKRQPQQVNVNFMTEGQY